jgi:LAS superfamily LD-carboxypeptidase LdcB
LLSLAPEAQVTSTYRSFSEQLALYQRRFTNRYPVAPPGRSWHQYRRAFDVNARPEILHQLGAVWNSWGGTWHPSDEIHFQA